MASTDSASQKHAPTFVTIIVLKLLKGTLFMALAISAYKISNNDLVLQYAHFLEKYNIDPERQFWGELAEKVASLTETKLLWTAAGTFIYSLFSLVEGIGLIFRVSWAGWLAIGESAFFIPVELYELIHRFSLTLCGVFVLNIVIVWYLLQNRHRLFKHH